MYLVGTRSTFEILSGYQGGPLLLNLRNTYIDEIFVITQFSEGNIGVNTEPHCHISIIRLEVGGVLM